MKILGLISSLTDPSSRARILQYREHLEKENISLRPRYFYPHSYADPAPWAYKLNKITRINPWRFLWLQKSISRSPLLLEQYQFDLIWQNRLVIPQQNFYERKFVKPAVFDIDDAIWLHDGEKKVTEAMTRSAMIFAGNEYLAGFAQQHNKNVQVIPSVIDTEKLFPAPRNDNYFTIGWIGSVSNLRFLELVKPAVLDFLGRHKDARFMIVSSERPAGFNFDDERIIFKQWSAEKENELINEFSIGLMPLEDNEFTRGKCSYKMLQYLACAKPVVVSPVGLNKDILGKATIGFAAVHTEDWLKAFTELRNDASLFDTCGQNGRKLVVEQYSVNKYTPIIAAHFRSLLGK